MVPMFAPDGTLGSIPYERMHEAITAGGKLGVTMKAPDGTSGVIPADRVGEAQKAGGRVIPFNFEGGGAGSEGGGNGGGNGSLYDQGRASYDAKQGNVENPGASEGAGLRDALGGYVEGGPGEVGGGIADILRGNIARGAHRTISGAGTTMLPALPFAAAAAPGMMLRGAAGGYAGSKLAHSGAEAIGATPDQADLAGDLGGLAGGSVATSKVPGQLARRGLLLGRTPEDAYQSALKPSTTLSEAERAQVVNTGLQEKFPVTKGGLEKLGGLIDDLNKQISGVIATDPTRPINKFAATAKLAGTAKRFATQVNPESDLNAISESGNEFLRNQPNDIPAADAQALKQGTYRALGDKAYGELKGSAIEAQKSLARGLKDELANQFPELGDLNARDSRAIDLQDELERAVNRIGNHQLVGIGTPLATAGVKAATGSNKLAAVAGVMKAVLDNPGVKSKLAIALSNSGVGAQTIQSRIAGYIGALTSLAPSEQDATPEKTSVPIASTFGGYDPVKARQAFRSPEVQHAINALNPAAADFVIKKYGVADTRKFFKGAANG
jgi:hypothetical protein